MHRISRFHRPALSRRGFLKLCGLTLLACSCRVLDGAGRDPPLQNGNLPSPTGLPPTHTPTPFQPGVIATAPPTPSAAASPSPSPSPTPAPEPFFIVDGHVDLAWNALEFGRDPRLSAHETRLREQNSALPSLVGDCTTGLPDWTAGGVGLIFATVFVIPAANAYPGYTKIAYSTPEEAARIGKQVRDYYHALVEQEPALKLIRTRQDLAALQAERLAGKQTTGLVLLMEGADPLGDPQELPEWHDSGLRIVGPAWHATRYAGGTAAPGPLTDLGYRLLDEMAALNMILDLSHLSEQAFYQAVEHYAGPVIASHSNPRRFVPGDRNFSDDMIRQVAGREGVIGVSLYNAHLQQGWRRGDARPSLSLAAEAIDYMVQLTGSSASAALGTDMDGGFGLDSIPQEIDTAADIGLVGTWLARRGYGDADVKAVLMGNWLRILQSSLPG